MLAGIDALDFVSVDGLSVQAAWHPYADLDALLDELAADSALSTTAATAARVMLRQIQPHGRIFALGFVLSRQQPARWHVIPLLHRRQRWWRVLLEPSSCTLCGWHGLTANPCEPGLFYAHEDWQQLLRTATEAAQCTCPRCAGPLPHKALWVEERADWEW